MGNKQSQKKIVIVEQKTNQNSDKIIEEEPLDEITKKNEKKIIDEKPINKLDNKTMKEDQMEETKENIENFSYNIIGKFGLDFFGDTLTPDFLYLIGRTQNLVYFDLTSMKDDLEKLLRYIKDNFPKNYEDLEQPLEDYMKTKKNNMFHENRGFFKTAALKMKFIFGKESFNEEVRRRAKRLAYLLMQLYHKIKENKDKNYCLGMIDPINLKVKVFPYSILEEINEEIRFINIKRNSIDEIDASLNILNEKFKEVLQNIDEDSNDDNKKVLKAFLANEIHKKLKEIEKVSFSKETDTYKKMKSLRSKVNKTILENLDIDSNFDANPFFDEDYDYTIIKNTKKEKNILLTGDYINKFKAQLKQDFKNLQNSLKKFDKDEEEMNFIKKSMDKIEKLENEEDKIMKEINKINQKNFEQGIEIGKNIVANFKNKNDKEQEKEKLGEKLDKTLQTAQKVGDNIFQIKDNIIDKNSLENKEIIINYNKEETKKLIHLHALIEKIESVTNEKKEYNIDGSINGLMICKKINNSENQIINSFNVKIIY
jgi:hypothetical protein